MLWGVSSENRHIKNKHLVANRHVDMPIKILASSGAHLAGRAFSLLLGPFGSPGAFSLSLSETGAGRAARWRCCGSATSAAGSPGGC
jgi:hypothetical protein